MVTALQLRRGSQMRIFNSAYFSYTYAYFCVNVSFTRGQLIGAKFFPPTAAKIHKCQVLYIKLFKIERFSEIMRGGT